MFTNAFKAILITLVLYSCTASRVKVLDGSCRERSLRTHQRDLVVTMSYPFCRGCVEKLSVVLYENANIYGFKTVYMVKNTIRSAFPCNQNQTVFEQTRMNYPYIKNLWMLPDTASQYSIHAGLNIFTYNGHQLQHDSMFKGMQLDTGAVMRFLRLNVLK